MATPCIQISKEGRIYLKAVLGITLVVAIMLPGLAYGFFCLGRHLEQSTVTAFILISYYLLAEYMIAGLLFLLLRYLLHDL